MAVLYHAFYVQVFDADDTVPRSNQGAHLVQIVVSLVPDFLMTFVDGCLGFVPVL